MDEQDAQREHEKFEAEVMASLTDDDGVEPGSEVNEDTDDDQQATQGEKPGASEQDDDKKAEDDSKPEGKADDKPADDEDGLTKAERRALRAARRGERLARQEAERLRKQLEQVTGKKGEDTATSGDELDDPDDEVILNDLKDDMPNVASRFQKVKETAKAMAARVRELEARGGQQASTHGEDDFVPDQLPPELQAEVDKVPELFDWQYDPQAQDRWDMAKRIDGFLVNHPAWKDKPAEERLRETARRVAQELGTTAAPAPQPKPTSKPKAAPKAVVEEDDVPETLSGMRGGDTPRKQEADYSRMSDDAILASLRHG